MDTEITPITRNKAPHHGDNVKKVRRLRNIKQAALAEMLEKSVNTMYDIEKKAVIPDDTLEMIADKLKVHIDILKNLTDDSDIQITVHTNNGNVGIGFDIQNDVNQIVQALTPLYNQLMEKGIQIHDLKRELEQYKNKK